MYLLGFCLDVVYAGFREIWSEWLLGVRRRVAGKERWYGIASRRASKHRRGGRAVTVLLGLDGHRGRGEVELLRGTG